MIYHAPLPVPRDPCIAAEAMKSGRSLDVHIYVSDVLVLLDILVVKHIHEPVGVELGISFAAGWTTFPSGDVTDVPFSRDDAAPDVTTTGADSDVARSLDHLRLVSG